MYDRTAAIGLLDGQPRQFGSVAMSYNDIAAAGQLPLPAQCGGDHSRSSEVVRDVGESLCRLSAEETATRFANTQDAAKSNNYCGDVAYVAALLKARSAEMGRDRTEMAVGCSGRGGRPRGRGQCQSLRVDGVWISLVPTSYAMT